MVKLDGEILHQPVLLKEVLSFAPKKEGLYIDCTLGTGGHSEALLENNKRAKVIGIDLDIASIRVAKRRLAKFSSRITFIEGNFRHLESLLHKYRRKNIIFILYDLGFSSYQLNCSNKGFSFKRKECLDMRYSSKNDIKPAAYIINHYSEEELYYILRHIGEERWARRISKAIIKERKKKTINYTDELREIILNATPAYATRLDPATRTFLALRIVVNDELNALKESLPQAIKILSNKGRVCVISFNSQEERIVKEIFKEYQSQLNILSKKPITPTLKEKLFNPLSSSAKLRCAEKK